MTKNYSFEEFYGAVKTQTRDYFVNFSDEEFEEVISDNLDMIEYKYDELGNPFYQQHQTDEQDFKSCVSATAFGISNFG